MSATSPADRGGVRGCLGSAARLISSSDMLNYWAAKHSHTCHDQRVVLEGCAVHLLQVLQVASLGAGGNRSGVLGLTWLREPPTHRPRPIRQHHLPFKVRISCPTWSTWRSEMHSTRLQRCRHSWSRCALCAARLAARLPCPAHTVCGAKARGFVHAWLACRARRFPSIAIATTPARTAPALRP